MRLDRVDHHRAMTYRHTSALGTQPLRSRTNLKSRPAHLRLVAIPLALPGRTLETVRVDARRRLLVSSGFLALGALLLGIGQSFLVVVAPVGVLTGLILGALLLVLGLGSGAYAAVLYSHAFPLSESGSSARFALLAALFVAVPVCAGVTAVYALLAFPEPPLSAPTVLVLIPGLPFFWGPSSAVAGVGLLYAARDLASERMVMLAGIGCGAVIAMAVSAGGGALVDPIGALRSSRLAADLFIVAAGFVLLAAAFHFDAWAARPRRTA